MNQKQTHIDDAILLKVLDNKANEKETELFKSWYEKHADNARAFNQLKKVYQLSSIDENSKKKNWEAILKKYKSGIEVQDYIELPGLKSPVQKIRMATFMRVAASVIILIGIYVLLKVTVFNPKQVIISGNDLEQNAPFQLKDGSFIYLNGNSEIMFTKGFGTKNREITLNGEAFFEVKRNEQIPFTIKTDNTITKVVGTSFNICSDQSEKVRVSVVSGMVEFSAGKRESMVTLKAGEQGLYIPESNTIEKSGINDPNFQSWKTGVLYFDETPLDKVFQLLQKQYSHVFVIEAGLKEIPSLTTTIENEPLEAVLEELNLLLNTNLETKNDTIIFKPNS